MLIVKSFAIFVLEKYSLLLTSYPHFKNILSLTVVTLVWILLAIFWLNAVSNDFSFANYLFGGRKLLNHSRIIPLSYFSFSSFRNCIYLYNFLKLHSFNLLQRIVLTVPTLTIEMFWIQLFPILLGNLCNHVNQTNC